MKPEYSRQIVRQLEDAAFAAEPLRPYKRSRFEPGDQLELEITGVVPAVTARVRFEFMKFVGGGFAGQVYQIEIKELICEAGDVAGLEVGGTYALKILVPPSRFSKTFRNLTYWLAYQGPFSAQVNPAANRVGVLWQKLIRRGAKIRLGRENAVVDTYATCYVPELHSFAEINEWVPGRTWLYEIDDKVFERGRIDLDSSNSELEEAASREFLGKRVFMHRLVRLFHEMGAPELARQYEWWTAKSQPNALRRHDTDSNGPTDGLCAIDFRAGLALLPFVPMSPGDFRLISDGFNRGHAVQFDRGNLDELEAFVGEHRDEFEDLLPALDELKEVEKVYRASLPDVTHHGTRVLFDDDLRPRIRDGLVQGYRCNDVVDEKHAATLERGSLPFILFYLAGILPLVGGFLRKLWGNGRYREHIVNMVTDFAHTKATLRARTAESLIGLYRAGKIGAGKAIFFLEHPFMFFSIRALFGVAFGALFRFLLGEALDLVGIAIADPVLSQVVLGAGTLIGFLAGFLPFTVLHRAIVEPGFVWGFIRDGLKYGWRFYRDPSFREKWLTDQVESSYAEGMLTEEEREKVLRSVKDPFIQKYLKCVAVHVCTLPVTQVVSLAVAIWVFVYYGQSWEESAAYALGVLAAFQVMPMSPGSLVRGSYVVYLMIRERNVRNYWVAALVSFWKYIGYFGFPIQMVKTYPDLARLMAGRYATAVVSIIPVFGEKGALLEHWIFDLFFNVPLSLTRKWKQRREQARTLEGGNHH